MLAIEGRAALELASGYAMRPVLRRAPQGDGHPVLVLPGFIASGISTRPLRDFLNSHNYLAKCWKLGRNLGLRDGIEERLADRLDEIKERYGRKVSLVGWSLGGVFARELARKRPDDVRQVITLGSPFAGSHRANHSWRLFEWVSGRQLDGIEEERIRIMREPPPVPTTAIYSRTDGITDWRCCIEREAPRVENIEVRGSHCGLGVNPVVMCAIADRLAQPEGYWRPFRRGGVRRLLFGRSIFRRDVD